MFGMIVRLATVSHAIMAAMSSDVPALSQSSSRGGLMTTWCPQTYHRCNCCTLLSAARHAPQHDNMLQLLRQELLKSCCISTLTSQQALKHTVLLSATSCSHCAPVLPVLTHIYRRV